MADGFTTGLTALSVGPLRIFIEAFERDAAAFLGRDIDIRFGEGEVKLRPRALHLHPTAAGMARGILDGAEIVADDVRWAQGRVDELTLKIRGMRIAGTIAPTLIAGPIDVDATLSSGTVGDWLATLRSDWRLQITDDATIEARHVGHERWGKVLLDVTARDRTLTLTPRSAVIAGRTLRRPVKRFTSPITLTLPRLPGNARVLSVTAQPGAVAVRAVVDEIREPVSLTQLRATQRALGSVGAGSLVIPRLRGRGRT